MFRRSTTWRTSIVLLVALLTGPSHALDRPEVGHWQTLPGFDVLSLERIDDLCWHQGRLYATGDYLTPRDNQSGGGHVPALLVWQDEQWHHVRDLSNLVGHKLASDGHDLVVVQGGTVHRWRDLDWQRFDGGFVGPVNAATFWRNTLVVGGFVGAPGSREKPFLMQWDDEVWRPLGGGIGGVPEPQVAALLSRDDGLWVAGRFRSAGTQTVGNVARWDGQTWDGFGGGADGEVVAMSPCGPGVAIAGIFTQVDGTPCPGLAVWREGAWQPLPAMPLDDDPSPYMRGLACPMPTVTHLADLHDGLVAFGRFTFVDARGDTARNVAVLAGEQWCRWKPGEQLLLREVPSAGRVEGQRLRGLYDTSVVAVDGNQTAIIGYGREGEALVALVRDDVSWIAYPRVPPRSWPKLAQWRDSPLLLGTEYVGPRRVGGLARLVAGQWEPIADWLGTDDRCGGRVHAVTEWHGDLVVTGSFSRVADQDANQVAAFDGVRWRPLGDGIAGTVLDGAQLLARREDLVVFGVRGESDYDPVNCRRWNGKTWTVVPLPENTSPMWYTWNVAAAGDTLWALVPRTDGHWKKGDSSADLYALVDTTWHLLASFHDPVPQSLAYWNGALHGRISLEPGVAMRLARWNGAEWQNALRQDLAVPDGGWDIQFLDDGRCLFRGLESTLCWDGVAWSLWPGREGYGSAVSLQGGRFLRLTDSPPSSCEIWEGPLPSPDPSWQPPEPVVLDYREQRKIARDDLPRIGPENASRWWFYDQGGHKPPGKVSARGRRGLKIEGEVDLACEVQTKALSWCRLTGKITDRIKERHCAVTLGNANARQLYSRIDSDAHYRDRYPADGKLDLLVPFTADSLTTTVWFSQNAGETHVEDLAIESGQGLFVEALTRFHQTIRKRWRPPVGGGPVMPATLTPALVHTAQSAFSLASADSILLEFVNGIADQRIWVDGPTQWRPDPMPQGLWSPDSRWRDQDRHRRYTVPENPDPCEPLPDHLTAWLEGDLAYQHCPDPDEIEIRDDWLPVPQAWRLQAQGLVLDLRGPDHSPRCRGERVCNALWCLGAGDFRWARSRDSGGKTGHWWDLARVCQVSKLPRVTDLPIVVLISRHTDGAHALLAEALSRLANVTLVGEATAPLPARDEAVRVPWGNWSLMIPAGTWEDPKGRTLTDRRIAPDVSWPADDTDGLIEQARVVVRISRQGRTGGRAESGIRRAGSGSVLRDHGPVPRSLNLD